jgi:hypothetical protein
LSVDDLVTRVASISFIAALDATEQDAVLAEVREIVAGRSEVELPYVTEAHWCRAR